MPDLHGDFEVIVLAGSRELARATAESAPAILRAGQALHDEAAEGIYHGRLDCIFLSAGLHVRTVTGRPA